MDYVVRLLAVVGGAAVGAVIVSLVVRFASRFLGVKNTPKRALFVVRGLSAVAAGWLAWLFVFGSGGTGIGGSGGLGRGDGQSPEVGAGDKRKVETQLTLGGPVAEQSKFLPVAMLGGARVQGERFYLVVGEKESRTLDQLKEVLRNQQKNGLRGIEIVIYENSVAADHAAVKNLKDWARTNDLGVKVSFAGAEAP